MKRLEESVKCQYADYTFKILVHKDKEIIETYMCLFKEKCEKQKYKQCNCIRGYYEQKRDYR